MEQLQSMFPAPYIITSLNSPTYKVRRHVFKVAQGAISRWLSN